MTSGDGYHHGDLPNALRRAAVEVIDERGVGGFSLREVARRAGVSHTAPAHHFGDMKGLLTSLATEGFTALGAVMQEAYDAHDDPADRLVALGSAYVALASSHHAHCEVMFRADIVHDDDEHLSTCAFDSYQILQRTVAELIEQEHLSADLDHATWLCWSAMQGLVQLQGKIAGVCELQGKPVPDTDELIRQFTRLMLDGIRDA